LCTAPAGGLSLEGVDASKETVIGGSVTSAGQPVAGAYVRLLDDRGEFTAEVVTSATGGFRFFARPGRWTVRALTPHGNAEAGVSAALGTPVEVTVAV